MNSTSSRDTRRALAEQLAPSAARARAAHPAVRLVSQVTLELRHEEDDDVFATTREIVLRWVDGRAGRPLPAHAWQGEGFELEEVGSQRTAAVSIEVPRYWAARLDDGDKEIAQRTWVTEVGLGKRSDIAVVLGARLICVTRGEHKAFEPSIPRFVRTVVEAVSGVYLEGRRLEIRPWIIQSEDGVDALVGLIEKRDRKIDVVVCSLPEGCEDPAEATVNAEQIHIRTLGAAHVVVITASASFHLTDRVGKEFSVYRGAVRTYRPGFDTSQDEPFRHPLGLPHRIAGWPEGGREAYEKFLIGLLLNRSASVSDAERNLPPFTEARRIAAQLKLATTRDTGLSEADLLPLAEEEIANLRDSLEKDKVTYQGLVEQYEKERDLAQEEAQQMVAANNNLRRRVRSLEEQIRSFSTASAAPPIPSSLDAFETWCREHLSGSVEVHNRALQGVKKSRYEDVSLIYRALLVLRDAYVPMKRDGGLEKRDAFENACRTLGLTEEPTFSGGGWGEEGETYLVRYAGRRARLDRHLKKGTSRDERYSFRLYFFWDEGGEQVVVGWLPSHLDTRIT